MSANIVMGRERAATRRSVAASILAVLALVVCVVTIVVLAIRSTATRLQGEIASLTMRVDADAATLRRVRSDLARTGAESAAVGHAVSRLGGGVAGLRRTVHGLRIRSNVTQELIVGVHDCVTQLQRDFAGLALRTTMARGHVTSVGLTDSAVLPGSCGPAARPVSDP